MSKKRTRYIANLKKGEVHRLPNGEQVSANCQLEEIAAVHLKEYSSLAQALRAKLDRCAWCFEQGSKR
jgi:hypothetical protein